MHTRHFRAGIGTIIYNKDNEVAYFERATAPVGVWEFQQGGIDLGEAPITTLWRELKEEVGLDQTDIEVVTEYPFWTVYQNIDSEADPTIERLGQAHRWFFLKLKPGVTIDLSRATDVEVSDFCWLPLSEALARTEPYKLHVYQELAEFFKTLL